MSKKSKISKLGDIIKHLTKNKILENAKKEKQQSYDIRKIFEQMELDLISSMHKAFYFHKNAEQKEGFSWEQWQLSKLRAIEEYRKRNRELLYKYSRPIEECINNELNKSYKKSEILLSKVKKFFKIQLPDDTSEKQKIREEIANFLGRKVEVPKEEDFFKINDKKLEVLQKSVKQDIGKAQYSVLRKMDDVYRQTIFKTQVYMQTGAITLYKAIDMATSDFLKKGINSITYKDGKTVNIASYAEMCLRTASHSATLLGEGKKRDEWGIHLVVVSAHANTCNMCEPWQGTVLIDNVFSHPSDTYIYEYNKKYKLLSEALKKGLLHPNCRHTLITFFEGITNIPTIPDGKKAIETYRAEQKQRAYERAMRKQKRIIVGTCDLENKEKEEIKLKELDRKLREHLKKHKELRRIYQREEMKS